MVVEKGGPTPSKDAPRHTPPQFTFTLKLLLDWSVEAYGRLLLMGICLLFIGGVLTLGSYLTREDGSNDYYVWKSFLFMGVACGAGGLLCWIWKKLRKPM